MAKGDIAEESGVSAGESEQWLYTMSMYLEQTAYPKRLYLFQVIDRLFALTLTGGIMGMLLYDTFPRENWTNTHLCHTGNQQQIKLRIPPKFNMGNQ